MLDDPDSDGPRLAYAAWCDAAGDAATVARGAFLRAQIEESLDRRAVVALGEEAARQRAIGEDGPGAPAAAIDLEASLAEREIPFHAHDSPGQRGREGLVRMAIARKGSGVDGGAYVAGPRAGREKARPAA